MDPNLAFSAFEAENKRVRAARLAAASGRPVALDCEVAGVPPCWACAVHGPERCYENHVPREVHDACVAEARRLAVLRDKAPCHDCAFARGSDEGQEEGLLGKLARQPSPFHCHQAMPLDGRGRMPADGDFAPDEHSRYPVCAGWARARAGYLARVQAGKEMRRLRQRRPPPTSHERMLRALGLMSLRTGHHPVRRVELGKVARRDLCLWCVTRRRRALRAELEVVDQRHVRRGPRLVGVLQRRGGGDLVWHRVEGAAGTTPWLLGQLELALDAFAVLLYRAGERAGMRGAPRPDPPPYTRPPKGPRRPRPKSRRPPRPLPKPLILRAA